VRDLARHADEHRDRVREGLVSTLTDEARSVRIAALSQLGELGEKEALDDIIRAVDDSEAVVSEAAVEALGNIGDARALPTVEKALKDKRAQVRFQALIAYPRVGAERESAVKALIAATSDNDEHIVHIAFRVAEELADADGVGLDARLVERAAHLLKKSKAARVRAVAAVILASADDARGDDALCDIVSGKVSTSEVEDIAAAIELAGERKLTGCTEALERRAFGGFLGIGKDALAWHARTALARMGHARASAEILKDLGGFSHHTRTLAVVAAGRARLASARPRILAMRGIPSKAAQTAVDGALEELGEPAT
jgi:HEAT repeat protein